jgi:hypothetical protein
MAALPHGREDVELPSPEELELPHRRLLAFRVEEVLRRR